MKKFITILLILSLFMPSICKAKDSKINLVPNSKNAILVEATTGEVLFNKKASEKVSVASLTKMMGLILIFDTIEKGGLSLNDIVTVSENAKGMGGTQLYLDTGEKISVNDLIKGVVMASANDAMVALAERIAGTEEAFVEMMNKKANELGLKTTHFENSVGFDHEEHYSSASDMAKIAMELIKHEKVFEYSGTYESYIRENTDNKTWVVNTNKLVRFYEGADGLKTGWTENAGSSIAATAKRKDLRLIAIVLGYEKSNIRNQETMALLDYGFNQYDAKKLYSKGDIVGHTTLDKSSEERIDLVLDNDIIMINKKIDPPSKYQYDIEITKESLPIKKGEQVGTFIVKKDGKVINKTNLISKKDIERIDFFKLYLKTIKDVI